jgi:hypothetical protein
MNSMFIIVIIIITIITFITIITIVRQCTSLHTKQWWISSVAGNRVDQP